MKQFKRNNGSFVACKLRSAFATDSTCEPELARIYILTTTPRQTAFSCRDL